MNELMEFQENGNNDKKTMSSLEIAQLTGKRHSDVVSDIKRILTEVGLEATEFSAPFKMPSGQKVTVFNLPKRECNLIVAGYSAKYRLERKKWKTIKETHGTSSTRFAEENGYAKTIYEYIKINNNDIKTKRFVLKKKGLEKLISEFNKQ